MTAHRWMRSTSGLGVLGAAVLVAVLAGCGASSSDEVTPAGGTPASTATGGGTGSSTGVAGPGGSATSPIASGPVNTGPVHDPGPAKTKLTIVYNDGAGKVSTWTLDCDPTGGSHPHAALACKTLAAHGRQGLAPVPKGVMCPQIFSGAQTATITGTWNGNAVSASLKRSNGCETSRWRALQGLLPIVPINGAQ